MYRIEIYDTKSGDLICLLHGSLEDIANLIELMSNTLSYRFKISSL